MYKYMYTVMIVWLDGKYGTHMDISMFLGLLYRFKKPHVHVAT